VPAAWAINASRSASSPFAFRFVDQRGALLGLPARLLEVTGVPGDYPAGDRKPGRVAGGGERTGLFDAQIGQSIRGRHVGGGGERPRGAPVAGGVAQITHQLQQLTPVRGGRVREGLLRPPLAVMVGADGGRSSRRRSEPWHRLAATARCKQVIADLFG
jgi:hypothetical protein